jgi:hypothetical protein
MSCHAYYDWPEQQDGEPCSIQQPVWLIGSLSRGQWVLVDVPLRQTVASRVQQEGRPLFTQEMGFSPVHLSAMKHGK